ncbi:hypothetical protein GCM10027343_15740 [Noviherbaspirillum agri]
MSDLEHGSDMHDQPTLRAVLRATSWSLRALLALALLLPLFLAAWFAWYQRTVVLEDVADNARRSVVALEAHAANVLQTHALILQQIASMTEGRTSAQIRTDKRLQQTLAALANDFRQVSILGITDADGRVIASSIGQPAPGTHSADRDYFLAHANGTARGMFFSQPFTGRLNGIRQFAISIARTTPAGAFDGVIYAAVPLDYFTRFWRQFVPSSGYLIPLMRDDGVLLARYPAVGNPDRLEPNGPFMTHVRRQPRGVYTAVSLVDGIERMNAYSQIHDYPLYVSYSIEIDTALQRWRSKIVPVLMWASIAAAALVALWLVVVRQAYRQRATSQRWRATARKLENEITRREEAEEALRQGQKMEAIGHLAGGIAHDFNNLLAGIVGHLQLMRIRLAQGKTEDIARHISAASSVSDKATAMTQRLLAFSRRQALSPKVTNVNERVASMQELIQRTVGPAIRVQLSLSPDIWNTRCDPNQLETALLNLAINARDAMPQGGKLVFATVNTALAAEEARAAGVPAGHYVAIRVSDSGTGMPPHVVQRAFDPFFTTKPIGQGTGLGLSMVYGFAKQSEGGIRIDSEPGVGTSVQIYLPMTMEKAAAEKAPPAPLEPPIPATKATILLVEDEMALRDLLSEMLSELGYRVLQAADVPAGLKIVESAEDIDLLVTDVGLPGSMNGVQLADTARAQRSGLKVMFITGYADKAAAGSSLQARGAEVMIKPFDLADFTKKVYSLLCV